MVQSSFPKDPSLFYMSQSIVDFLATCLLLQENLLLTVSQLGTDNTAKRKNQTRFHDTNLDFLMTLKTHKTSKKKVKTCLPSPKEPIVKGFEIILLVKSVMSFKVSPSTVFRNCSTGFLQYLFIYSFINTLRCARRILSCL